MSKGLGKNIYNPKAIIYHWSAKDFLTFSVSYRTLLRLYLLFTRTEVLTGKLPVKVLPFFGIRNSWRLKYFEITLEIWNVRCKLKKMLFVGDFTTQNPRKKLKSEKRKVLKVWRARHVWFSVDNVTFFKTPWDHKIPLVRHPVSIHRQKSHDDMKDFHSEGCLILGPHPKVYVTWSFSLAPTFIQRRYQ